jgi:hypothetical protein
MYLMLFNAIIMGNEVHLNFQKTLLKVWQLWLLLMLIFVGWSDQWHALKYLQDDITMSFACRMYSILEMTCLINTEHQFSKVGL